MCKLKSAIILKDRVFIPDYDSHTDMLKELGIEDSRKNAATLFVRAELSPKNGDVFSNVDTWEFNVDQDIRPEWFVEPYEKERMVKAVKEWADKHVLIGCKNEEISNGTYYLKDCIDIKFYDNSTVKAYNNSTVTACDNSTVKAYNNSTVEAYDNSTVKAYNNSTVEAYDNSTVEACDNSTAIIPDWSSNKHDNIVLMQNSTLKDCKTKTIYQSGDWQFVKVEETKA